VVTGLRTVNLQWEPQPNGAPPKMVEVPGSEKEWKADLVLLALGFVGPETDSFVKPARLRAGPARQPEGRGNYATNVPGVFAAGDARRGQSLIVWAISEGRECARGVDTYLMGSSLLPTKVGYDLPRV
jgi:glutamate synthase (NADPH/NADH) small chain